MHALFGLRIALGLAVVALLAGCQGSGSTPAQGQNVASLDDPGVRTALGAITGDLIRQHIATSREEIRKLTLHSFGLASMMNSVQASVGGAGLAAVSGLSDERAQPGSD